MLRRAFAFICRNGAFRKLPITENFDLARRHVFSPYPTKSPKKRQVCPDASCPRPMATTPRQSRKPGPSCFCIMSRSHLPQSRLTPHPPPRPADSTDLLLGCRAHLVHSPYLASINNSRPTTTHHSRREPHPSRSFTCLASNCLQMMNLSSVPPSRHHQLPPSDWPTAQATATSTTDHPYTRARSATPSDPPTFERR